MRVLLDACVPKRLGKELAGHQVYTVPEMGWADLDDGPLLDAMTGHFDVFVTVDKSLPKQQNLRTRPFGVILLRAQTNRLTDLLPLIPALHVALGEVHPGEVCELS